MSKIVTSDIPFGSAYAYRVGDVIEDDAVKANDWGDYVANRGTKAANEALGIADEPAPAPAPPRKRTATKRAAPAAPPTPDPAAPGDTDKN